jgi:NADH-quinone oxidoreductase subunit J
VTLTIVVLTLTLMSAAWTVMTGGLIRAVLGLAATSICITVLMFMLGASLAAVFELSVCAGLITVVFISTISMTQPASKSASAERTRAHLRRYWFLPLLLAATGAIVAFICVKMPIELPPPTDAVDARRILWESRQTDLLGQAIALLAGVFGVIVLFKERNKR